MNILMLSWEYPPRVIGGLARHVQAVSTSLSQQDVNVKVLTIHNEEMQGNDVRLETYGNKLTVARVNGNRFKQPTFLDWVYQFNATITQTALLNLNKWKPDLIHAHDWLVAPSAAALKHIRKIPLISTIHSTELGRSGGLEDDFQKHIAELESFLVTESSQVIVASNHMKKEVSGLFGLPGTKIHVIPNGIHGEVTKVDLDLPSIRSRYALPWENVVLFVGRMFEQKGPHILLDAAFQILATRQDFKFVFVGEGPLHGELQERASQMGMAQKMYFTGFITDTELFKLYAVADMAVFPSLYEPFGIVCLEAMAAGCTVIASNVGGFSEIIRDGYTGRLVPPNDSGALAGAISYISDNLPHARRLGANAKNHVLHDYRWDKIADQTFDIYRVILAR